MCPRIFLFLFYMRKNKIFLFLVINLILSTFYFDTWPNGNTTSRVLPVVSVIENGTFHFEMIDSTSHDKSIINGKHYTDKAPLPTLMMIPISFVLKKVGLVHLEDKDYSSLYAWSGFIFGTIPLLIILLLTFNRAHSGPFDILYILLPFYGSFIFSYSASMYSHVFAGFLLVLAYIFLERKSYFLSGIFIGAVFISEYPLALVGLIWGLQVWYKNGLKNGVLFGLGVFPSLVLIAIYNYSISGNPFTLLYKYVDPNYAFMHKDYGFGIPSVKVMLQLLFGQYKGLVVYCPIILLVFFFGIKKWLTSSSKWKKFILHPIAVPFIASVVLISSYQMWWGGWAFGPRHLIGVTILLLFFSLPILARMEIKRWIGYPMLFIGVLIGLMAKTTYIYSIPTDIEYPLWHIGETLVQTSNSNPNNVLTHFFDISSRFASYMYIGLFMVLVVLLSLYERRLSLKRTPEKK